MVLNISDKKTFKKWSGWLQKVNHCELSENGYELAENGYELSENGYELSENGYELAD